jgi:glucosyl-3-phosphoglycerate synthase
VTPIQAPTSPPLREWFASRSFDSGRFAGVEALADRKRELGWRVSVVLPCREVAGTIGAIAAQIRALNARAPLVDQVVAVDAGSADGTADLARAPGLEVFDEDDLMPAFGPARGKGDAMWRGLSVADGDLVVFADSDTANFGPHFVYGLLGPLLTDPGIRFVKATYYRPYAPANGAVPDIGGRVTELTAKPLFAAFYPELAAFGQPLAGEVAARRDLLCSIPFTTGYAVETAMMIDVLQAAGLTAMAQVDLGTRLNRHQPLPALGAMSFEVVSAIVIRLMREGRLSEAELPAAYLRAACTPAGVRLDGQEVELIERPPMVEALAGT